MFCNQFSILVLAGLFKNGQIPDVPDCKPWVDDGFWDIKRSNNAIVDEAYKQFSGMVQNHRFLCNITANPTLLHS